MKKSRLSAATNKLIPQLERLQKRSPQGFDFIVRFVEISLTGKSAKAIRDPQRIPLDALDDLESSVSCIDALEDLLHAGREEEQYLNVLRLLRAPAIDLRSAKREIGEFFTAYRKESGSND